MVVELSVVPINEIAYLLVNGHVASIGVVRSADEVRSLRRMSEEVLADGQDSADRKSAVNEPLFSSAFFHCIIVFPVEIDAV